MAFALTENDMLAELRRYGGESAQDPALVEVWDRVDEYYKREHEILLPEATRKGSGDSKSLTRLLAHTNFAKIVVRATISMCLQAGIRIHNADDQRDEKEEKAFDMNLARRLLLHMTRYGGAWLQVIEGDSRHPYRVYKPHVARQIFFERDPQKEQAVIVIERRERQGDWLLDTETVINDHYYVARVYEWDDNESVVSQDDTEKIRVSYFEKKSGGWVRSGRDKKLTYMPFLWVANRQEDDIAEASDLVDGLELFGVYDILRSEFSKALEDEAFRLIFLSSIDDKQAAAILAAGGMRFWFAKNKPGENPPDMQSVSPADHRQFIDALDDLMDDIAMVTRTSPMELNERPEGDIPAQTLRVRYGPQLARCAESAENLSTALTYALHHNGKRGYTVEAEATLPIAEDKKGQTLKGLADIDALSKVRLLMDTLGITQAEAQKIYDLRLEELAREVEIETSAKIKVEQSKPKPAANSITT